MQNTNEVTSVAVFRLVSIVTIIATFLITIATTIATFHCDANGSSNGGLMGTSSYR